MNDAWLVADIAQLQCAGGIATLLENSPIISFIILNCCILSKIEEDNSQEYSKMCMRESQTRIAGLKIEAILYKL